MSCDEYRDEIIDLAAGELSPKDAERVRGHLAACADCSRELAETELLLGVARQALEREAPALKAPPDVVARKRARPGWRIPAWAAAAGMLICAVTGASLGYIEGRGAGAQPERPHVRVAAATSDFWNMRSDTIARLKSASRQRLEGSKVGLHAGDGQSETEQGRGQQ